MAASEALSAIYDASYSRLVAQLMAICGNQQEAEDAVQEAFVKAIRQGRRFDDIANPEAWLRTVAINTQRTRWHRGAVLKRLLPEVPGPVRPIEPTPERVAIADALARLRPEWRTVVVLHHLADQTLPAITPTPSATPTPTAMGLDALMALTPEQMFLNAGGAHSSEADDGHPAVVAWVHACVDQDSEAPVYDDSPDDALRGLGNDPFYGDGAAPCGR